MWNVFVLFAFAVFHRLGTFVSAAILNAGSCLREYVQVCENNGFPLDYIIALRSQYENHTRTEIDALSRPIILDVGLASVEFSDVFEHFVQLNISGRSHHDKHVSAHCRKNYVSGYDASKYETEGPVYIYAQKTRMPQNWVDLVLVHPNVRVLMSDVSDQNYFDRQHSSICNSSRRHDYCTIPFISVDGFTDSSMLLISKFTFYQVKSLLAAYRSLVSCLVPEKKLFSFDLLTMTSSEYWTKLTSFLGLSVSDSKLKHLSEGGSVCSPVSPIHNKLVKCSQDYSVNMASIVGSKYQKYILNQLLRDANLARYDSVDSERLVINVAPGTTGTKTLHFSMIVLNVTTYHFTLSWQRNDLPTKIEIEDFETGKVLSIESAERRMYWSDIPTTYRWFKLYRMYPNMNIVFTDVDSSWWYHKRRKDHCRTLPAAVMYPKCLVPVPFRFTNDPLSWELFPQLQLANMTLERSNAMFDAYKQLVRCTIDEKKLWWFEVAKLTDPVEYWSKLIKVAGVNVSEITLQAIVAKGIPRCAPDHCYWGGQDLGNLVDIHHPLIT